MSLQTWQENLVTSQVDGATLTAAAAASCIPAAAKYTLQPNFFSVGKRLKLTAFGRISCVVTTPGTARFDLRFGGTVVMDSLAMPLNIVAKTNVPWRLDVDLVCRAIGASANLMWTGEWRSEAVLASPAATAGGSGEFLLPYNAAPAVGSNFDSTTSQVVDMFFTQTVATGSMTCHGYSLDAMN